MVEIIAEIGVNFRDIDHFKKLISACIESGAYLIKGQYFRDKDIQGRKDYSVLKGKAMDESTATELMRHAALRNAELFWTPENAEVVDEVINLSPVYLKVGSNNYNNREMARLCGLYREVTLVSLPIGHLRDTAQQQAIIDEAKGIWGKEHIEFFYCVPKYPPKLADINIFNYDSTVCTGTSLHYDSMYPHLYGVWAGARFIEVHVKDSEDQIDSQVSITPSELKVLCREAMNYEAMKGWQKTGV